MTSQSRPNRWTTSVGGLLWIVALTTLALGAILSPPNRSGVIGLVMLGHLLTGVAVLIDLKRGRRRGPDDALFLTGVLAVAGMMEVCGLVMASREWQHDQALSFAVAASFAAAGIVACWRGRGSDGAIAAQLFFHGLQTVPALPAAGLIVRLIVTGGDVVTTIGPVTRLLFLVVGVALPPLFVMLMTVLAYDLGRHPERPSTVWSALVAHQAAYVVLSVRWTFDGL